uniref:Uncharacterized protein n=1 Tax=Aegilops tauschii subsp. strangulata TaxID=200361 RepID=A0A453DSH8_AEGTS
YETVATPFRMMVRACSTSKQCRVISSTENFFFNRKFVIWSTFWWSRIYQIHAGCFFRQ